MSKYSSRLPFHSTVNFFSRFLLGAGASGDTKVLLTLAFSRSAVESHPYCLSILSIIVIADVTSTRSLGRGEGDTSAEFVDPAYVNECI